MSPAQYCVHPNHAIRRAFWRGVDAAAAGLPVTANPYRQVRVVYRARRGSWSETYTLAFATGWHWRTANPPPQRPELAVAGVEEESA